MVRPEVRIIEPQSEESREVNVSDSERDFLLAKYGYKESIENSHISNEINPDMNLSFEELIYKEEQKMRERETKKNSLPNPYSFDRGNVNYYENKYSDLGIDGQNYGINIQVMSDMPITNNRNRR
jgi:hypothetical protein